MASKEQRRGTCEGCDRPQMVLRPIQSGQNVCQACLREIRGPGWSKLATLQQVAMLKAEGYSADDTLTKDEYNRIRMSQALACRGLKHDPAAPLDILTRLVESTSVSTWCMNVAGVSSDNPDGSSRQIAISNCRVGDVLVLKRQPKNQRDSSAIAVLNSTGSQVGFIPRQEASVLSGWIDSGSIAVAVVRRIDQSDSEPFIDYLAIVVVHARAIVESSYFRLSVNKIQRQVLSGVSPGIT